jgi:hypothetical protein
MQECSNAVIENKYCEMVLPFEVKPINVEMKINENKYY